MRKLPGVSFAGSQFESVDGHQKNKHVFTTMVNIPFRVYSEQCKVLVSTQTPRAKLTSDIPVRSRSGVRSPGGSTPLRDRPWGGLGQSLHSTYSYVIIPDYV